jgi:hypothetical protein
MAWIEPPDDLEEMSPEVAIALARALVAAAEVRAKEWPEIVYEDILDAEDVG